MVSTFPLFNFFTLFGCRALRSLMNGITFITLDMGFEPQIMRIIENIRPDRQTVMFSATFPRTVEAAARKILQQPLEITVGARSVVSDGKYLFLLPASFLLLSVSRAATIWTRTS